MQTNSINVIQRFQMGAGLSSGGSLVPRANPTTKPPSENDSFEAAWKKVEARLRALNALVPNPSAKNNQRQRPPTSPRRPIGSGSSPATR